MFLEGDAAGSGALSSPDTSCCCNRSISKSALSSGASGGGIRGSLEVLPHLVGNLRLLLLGILALETPSVLAGFHHFRGIGLWGTHYDEFWPLGLFLDEVGGIARFSSEVVFLGG